MKKIILIMVVLLVAHTTSVMSQTDTDVVNFTAVLEDVLNLNVTSGQDQTATFNTPDMYNLGIDAVGTTTITVESTSNWDVQINAADFSDGGGNIIPIDNLGVWCEATGTHVIGTEVTCSNTSLAAAMGITAVDQTILDDAGGNGGNGGDASDNAFNFNWTMGSMNGTMNAASMFQQISDGTIGSLGTYTTTVNLTLTAHP